MKITKMHGAGNDFILIDNREGVITNENELAARLCERRLNIGADGLMTVENSDCADIKMRIFNSDGSDADMCGNGIRCFSLYVYDRGMVNGECFTVETLSGVLRPEIIKGENGNVAGVKVDMGGVRFEAQAIPMLSETPLEHTVNIGGKDVTLHACLMNIPHTVVIEGENEVTFEDFDTLAPLIEKHELFPKNTNVNFVRIIDDKTVFVRTWERGAGPTLACGTGSCGVVCVLNKLGRVNSECTVKLAAGELFIEVGEHVFMTGPAKYVFEGEVL